MRQPQAGETGETGTAMQKKKQLIAAKVKQARALAPEEIRAMNVQARAARRPIVLVDSDPDDPVVIFDTDPTDQIIVI